MVDTDNGKVYACVGAGGIWEIFIPSTQFSGNLKLLIKKVMSTKNKQKIIVELL